MMMSWHRWERMVPPKRAMLALAASLSPNGSCGHHLGKVAELDEFDVVTTKLEQFWTIEMGMRGRHKELEHRVLIFFPVASSELETTYESSASYIGAMFDVRARDNVIILSISFNTPRTDYIKVQLYTQEGSYGGLRGRAVRVDTAGGCRDQGQRIRQSNCHPRGSLQSGPGPGRTRKGPVVLLPPMGRTCARGGTDKTNH